MVNNYYDDQEFFQAYSEILRSREGLTGAGEWESFKEMLPTLKDRYVLDLGCGQGWHCEYAIEAGAKKVVGIDLSHKMLDVARSKPNADNITYIQASVDELNTLEFESHEFDVVMSSLALHYLPNFDDIVGQVKEILTINGTFIFSIEHPVYTAHGSQDWVYDDNKEKLHWPVDQYSYEGERHTNFLGMDMTKYHRTLSHYLSVLIEHNFVIKGIDEPTPPDTMIDDYPEMKEELRRPMMLIVSARSK